MKNIKHILLAALMLLTMGLVHAQVKVYAGSSSYSGDIICKLSNGRVCKKKSSYNANTILWQEEKVLLQTAECPQE